MGSSSAALAAGWIPFAVVFLVTLALSVLYILYFRNRHDSEPSSTVTAILALFVSLLTSVILPVDVFLVSFMKSNGTFKDWASNSTYRQGIEDSVLYTYYAFYSLVLFFTFLVIPFMYFFYEEKDDDRNNTAERLCSAFKYTFVLLLLGTVLLLMGAFLPFRDAPKNGTEWEKFQFLISELEQNRGEDALSFVLGVLSVIGMITAVFYTGCGLSMWPITLIRGTRSTAGEYADVVNRKMTTQLKIAALQDKHSRNNRLSTRERQQLEDLEESERLLSREEQELKNVQGSCLYKCRAFLRPMQVVFGSLVAILSFILWLSLLLTNIDKAINSLGYRMGYTLSERKLFNPLDWVLLEAQTVFPFDYIIFICIVAFLVLCSMSSIQRLGIWFLFIRMYKIRPRRTRPQGLLMLCATLTFIILALHIIMYSVMPQYITYGSQHYWGNSTTPPKLELMQCSTDASQDTCIMTRASSLLVRFFYKAWFFGALYYWLSWALLGVSIVAFFVVLLRRRRSAIEGMVADDDFEESDDHLIRA